MDNTEKVEIGYTVPKERWIEAAKNLEDLGNVLAGNLLAINGDGRGQEDADALMADNCTGLPGIEPCGGVCR